MFHIVDAELLTGHVEDDAYSLADTLLKETNGVFLGYPDGAVFDFRLELYRVHPTSPAPSTQSQATISPQALFESSITQISRSVNLRSNRTTPSDHAFLFRHRPLSVTYCSQRLKTCAGRRSVLIKPHQLRHSCATLLLNAGAPVLTVQSILGHKFIDTTLGYARLYEGTVAADYYRAMAEIETRFEGNRHESVLPDGGQLLALVDSLHAGTLNDAQRETVQALRAGILAMAGNGNGSKAQAV